jgi:hypothetical protein
VTTMRTEQAYRPVCRMLSIGLGYGSSSPFFSDTMTPNIVRPRGRPPRRFDLNKPLDVILDELRLSVSSEGFLICRECQSFVSPNFHAHFKLGCPTRRVKHVSAAVVAHISRQGEVRDFRVPDVLPCPPFSGVKCIKGFKCEHCAFCSATGPTMSAHIKACHPLEDDKRYSPCFCQPTQAGKRAPLFPVTHDPSRTPSADAINFAELIMATHLQNKPVLLNTKNRIDRLYEQTAWFKADARRIESLHAVTAAIHSCLSDDQKAQLKGCIASIIRQARDAPYKVRQGWAQNVECLNNITDKTIDRYCPT